MAIIYSYPENNNILPTDILVCTSTALINGKPKNQTKNISIADLTAFMALNGDNLNDVLTNGNTSLLSANIGQLGLFDAQAQNYGSLGLSSSEFNFYNTSNVLTSTLTSDSLILYPNLYTGQLLVPNTITADRVYTFQNASGTVAYLSDIPALTGFVPYTGATASVNLGANSLTAASIIKAGGTNLQYLLADGSVSTGPVLIGFVPYTGATQAADLGVYSLTAGSIIKTGGTSSQYLLADGSVSTGPVLTGFVPYTGATQAVNLGAFNLTVNSISVGKGAGAGTTNTAIGNLALSSATIADFNTAVGYQASKNNISGNSLTAIGHNALSSNTTGSFNTAVGLSALLSNTVGEYNTAIGLVSLTTNISGNTNVALGHASLRLNTTGSSNTAIGFEALNSSIAVSQTVAVGYQSMRQNTTGAQNAAFGAQTLRDNTTGSGNTAVGLFALILNTTGSSNTLMGRAAGSAITTGNQNVGYGANTLLQCSIGSDNVGIGTFALAGSNSGSNNVGVGTNAGRDSSTTFNVTVNNSVFIGYETKANQSTDTNQIVIGYQAIGAGSNTATLGNTSITTTRLRGAVQGGSFVKDGGTAAQYLMADGSVTTGAPYKYNFSGSVNLTGTLATTNLLTIIIPANSLSDYLDLRSLMVQQSGPALAGFQIRVWHNSVNDFPSATRIANYAFGAGGADLFAQMTRKFSIQSGTLFGFPWAPSNATGDGSNPNAALSIAFNTAVVNYLFVSVQLNNVTDTAILRNVNITT